MGLSRGESRALRRRCEAVVAGIDIPEPFDLPALCQVIGERRGRRLRVATRPLGTGRGSACGLWIALPDEDVVVVEANTSTLHREQIGLHEIGHILCDHQGAPQAAGDLTRLLPSLDPAMIRRVLGRTSYDHPQEQEAELVATLLGEQIQARAGKKVGENGRSSVEGLARLIEALGGGSR